MMRIFGKAVIFALLSGVLVCLAFAQDDTRAAKYGPDSQPANIATDEASGARPSDVSTSPSHSKKTKNANLKRSRKNEKALTSDDRLAVIASALDSKTPRFAEHDCSHLVHAIFQRAGFRYAYVDSDQLYDGVEGFERVT